MATKLSAVTFDVWETLIHDPAGAEAKRVALRAERMATILEEADNRLAVPAADIVAAYDRALPDLEATWTAARDFDTPEQVRRVLNGLPSGPLPQLSPRLLEDLARAYASAAFDYPPELWPDTRPTLAEVARRGYRIGLVCNTGRTPGWVLRSLFEQWGILGYFEALAFSNETAVRKPDRAIFRGVLERLGARPEETLHVGDDAITDIAGAKALGMRAAMIRADSPHTPVPPDARLTRLGDLIPLLDGWAREVRF